MSTRSENTGIAKKVGPAIVNTVNVPGQHAKHRIKESGPDHSKDQGADRKARNPGADGKVFGIETEVFRNSSTFIRKVSQGVSGNVLRTAVEEIGNRDFFVKLMGVNNSNFSRRYKKDRINDLQGEQILDALRIFVLAREVFEDKDIAEEWISSPIAALGCKPIELCTTFEGRRLVRNTLEKIERGEFS